MIESNGLLGAPLAVDSHFLERFFRPFIVSGAARNLVAELINGTNRELAGQHHVNGFDKVVLASDPVDGRKLVLHDWSAPTTEAEIHNHRWDFVSYVVSGKISSHKYRETTADTNTFCAKFLYRSPEGLDNYPMIRSGSAWLEELESKEFSAGDFYLQENREVHSASYDRHETITLILQGPVLSPTTDVYVPNLTSPGVTRPVNHMSPDQVHSALGRLFRLLPDGRGE